MNVFLSNIYIHPSPARSIKSVQYTGNVLACVSMKLDVPTTLFYIIYINNIVGNCI